ncbi:MAG TPA: M20/M25/M40 family metallo-hydrolase [Ktedonobacteraceae bacterium]|nr:M20/M25/M40 family metallo-hydrolase [Ktedonobacteraceae bacterium]
MTTSRATTHIDWEAAGNEVVSHLQDLLRLDTRNPPGNEIRAAQHLSAVLQREGIDSQIIGPSPERASLVARLRGNGSEPPLLLMSHTDVVAVEPEKWTHDPFAADIADNFIYGRGALDMKNMVAMELLTMLLLKRSGQPLRRDVIFMAAADEEAGGWQGARWVAQNYPELIRAEYALNEGGGNGIEINGRRYYTVQTAEKGTARFRLRTTGTPGHGSVPHDDNAVLKLAELLARLRHARTPVHFTASARGYISGIAQAQPPEIARALLAILDSEVGADAAIDALPVEDWIKRELRAIIRNTIAPTMLRAGAQVNVIPSLAEATFDARTLPGWTTDMFLKELQAIFGEDADIEFVQPAEPLEADLASPLFDVIQDVMKRHDPEATIIPTLLTGATDAKAVAPLGTKVYGFAPELYTGDDGWTRVHGHDERIRVDALKWGARVLYEVVTQFAGS